MDLSKGLSKQSLSLQDLGGSSPAPPIPVPSKGKEFERGQKEVFTHFISLPLAIYSELKEEVEGFRDSILGKNNKKPVEFQSTLDEMRIQESMFVLPSRLHLTVVMLNLKDAQALVAAKATLENISTSVKKALDNRPVLIRLKGLECMDESLDETTVLYAPVEKDEDEGRLLRACHVMIDAFVPDKLAAERVKSRLKLHVTMMNAAFRRDKSKGKTFDAREIHRVFGDKEWGSYEIKKVDISKRNCFDDYDYYHSDGSLTLPTSGEGSISHV